MGRGTWIQTPVIHGHQGPYTPQRDRWLSVLCINVPLCILPTTDASVSQKVLLAGNSGIGTPASLKRWCAPFTLCSSKEKSCTFFHPMVLTVMDSFFFQKKIGSFGYSCLGCFESQSVRSRSRNDSFCYLPRCLERDGPFIRTVNYPYGPFRR